MRTGLYKPGACSLIRKGRTIVVIIIAILGCYYFISVRNFGRYTGHHPFHATMKCRNLADQNMRQLLDFRYKINVLLDDIEIDHWLMYGSLLGARHGHAPLIWDDDSDFGVNGNGRLSKLGKTEFLKRPETLVV